MKTEIPDDAELAPDIFAIFDVDEKDDQQDFNNGAGGANWREKGKNWLTTKAPVVKEGLKKSKDQLGKGLASVSSFTQSETKLLVSMAKRKIYCKSGKIEDPEFKATLELVEKWRTALEMQRSGLRRMIRDQRAYQESQRQLAVALRQVPDNGECSKNYLQFCSEMTSRSEKLVAPSDLQELVNQIDKILSKEHAEILTLKKRYQTAKNEADVCAAKIENTEENQHLHIELGRVTERYMQYKKEITDLSKQLLEAQTNTLNPILLKACNPVPVVLSNDLR